jgi:hypothetical protein
MRLEQRIGRLDRIGRTQNTFVHRIFLPTSSDYGPWFPWLRILQEGFQVFDESVADLQLVAVEFQKRLLIDLYRDSRVSDEKLRAIRASIADERATLERQYSLDRLEISNARATRRLSDAMEADRTFSRHAALIDRWWSTAGGLEKVPVDGTETFRLQRRRTTFPPPTSLRDAIGPAIASKHTYLRSVAIDVEGSRLVRPGHPLVDALPALLRDSNRGRASVLWRSVPGWVALHGEWDVLRLVFVVEAQVPTLEDGRRTLGDAYFNPWVEVVEIDAGLRRITDEEVKRMVQVPMNGLPIEAGRDFDGRISKDAVRSRLGSDRLLRVALDAPAAALSALAHDESFAARLEAAKAAASRRIHAEIARIERHDGLASTDAREPELRNDSPALRDLTEVVRTIVPRIEAMGLVILAGSEP